MQQSRTRRVCPDAITFMFRQPPWNEYLRDTAPRSSIIEPSDFQTETETGSPEFNMDLAWDICIDCAIS